MSEPIPVHHFSSDRIPIGVERIVKKSTDVVNGVHRHDFYEIFFFSEGSGDHMIDLRHHKFDAPCCHIVSPGQVHQLSRNSGSAGVVIMFAGDLDLALADHAKRTLFGPMGQPTIELPKGTLNEAVAIIKHIEAELKNDRAISINYLGILMLKCMEWTSTNGTRSKNDLDAAERFQMLVEEHFLQERKVAWFAAKMSLSAGHLSELCKKRLGKSASAIIKDRTLLEAKRLLLHSELSIKEVAYALNMEDPAYFTRMFKKSVGKGPQHFREQIRKKYK